MIKTTTLVSGCDANYFPLLIEWLHSVHSFAQSAELDICIIDGGMTQEQIKTLYDKGVKAVVTPPWPDILPAKKTENRDYLKPCVLRPFLPDLFPGYEIYMWLDADTWVQDWQSVALYLQCASNHHDHIFASGLSRCVTKRNRIKWIWRWPWRVASFYYKNGLKAFGFSIAKELVSYNVVSAGCFAMHQNAPHWKKWQELTLIAAKNGRLFPAEQLSLGVLLHLEQYKFELLPGYTHWVCNMPPRWNTETKMFEEPFAPYNTLGVLHLSGVDEMREDRARTRRYHTQTGEYIDLNIRYPHYDGGLVGKAGR